MNVNTIQKIVIAGGGTAGWMAAAACAKLLGKSKKIVLVESDEIATVGVGEATIPSLVLFHKILGIDERAFMRETHATFKLGIQFADWRDTDTQYFHGFGTTGKDFWASGFQHFWLRGRELGMADAFGDYCLEAVVAEANSFSHLPNNGLNYAYHLDAGAYAGFLRRIAEREGAQRKQGNIDKVVLDKSSGDIRSLVLASGEQIAGDLFIDCTGFRALLIEKALHVGYEDWSHWLINDRAMAVQTEANEACVPYTRSNAHAEGWQWRIPLQNRIGNGIVYSSHHLSDEVAEQKLKSGLRGECINAPKIIPFRTGRRREVWKNNCIALGLASGFLEPLESTSIHLIQQGILRLLRMFPHSGCEPETVAEFNRQTVFDTERIRDFIILHYKVTQREDSEYWRYCKNMDVPDTLAHRIDLFRKTGHVYREGNELFVDSWQQVMIGQGLPPERHHPLIDEMTEQELKQFLLGIRQDIQDKVRRLPKHQDYLSKYCVNQGEAK